MPTSCGVACIHWYWSGRHWLVPSSISSTESCPLCWWLVAGINGIQLASWIGFVHVSSRNVLGFVFVLFSLLGLDTSSFLMFPAVECFCLAHNSSAASPPDHTTGSAVWSIVGIYCFWLWQHNANATNNHNAVDLQTQIHQQRIAPSTDGVNLKGMGALLHQNGSNQYHGTTQEAQAPIFTKEHQNKGNQAFSSSQATRMATLLLGW